MNSPWLTVALLAGCVAFVAVTFARAFGDAYRDARNELAPRPTGLVRLVGRPYDWQRDGECNDA